MTYDYNASALAFGGVLKNADGTTTTIPSLASVHLAPTGGRGTAEVSDYSKYGVSFSTARSTVFGVESGNRTFTTGSDVFITDLNLFGRIQAAILQTNVTSTREVSAGSTNFDPDGSHFTVHAMIRGLVIDGVEVIQELDLTLTGAPTYQEFADKIRIGATTTEETALDVLTANVQPIRGSFIGEPLYRPTNEGVPRRGVSLPVPNLGKVHLGELVVKPGQRRVNLLRIEFGPPEEENNGNESLFALSDPSIAPIGGSATILSLMNNGAPSWP